jgi:TPP-dependent pyruvate/acetoin dehydrogenase alpha subunit
VASAYALGPEDALAPLIRNLGSLVTLGVPPRTIFAQYMARATSPTRGRDLNVHFSHLPPPGSGEPTIIGPISMLGDLIPVLAGFGLGARMQGRRIVAMTYIGDGGTSTGAFHEGLNFAAVQKLPLVLIAEDNKYAYSTPIAQQMAIGRIDQRADAYGIPHPFVDGTNVLAVYDAARQAVDRARAGDGPTLIGVDVMRMKGHAEHDDQRYVSAALLDEWRARDPIARYRAHLLQDGIASGTDLDEIDGMTHGFAETEAALAEADPMPDPSTTARGVWSGDQFMEPRLELVKSPFAART